MDTHCQGEWMERIHHSYYSEFGDMFRFNENKQGVNLAVFADAMTRDGVWSIMPEFRIHVVCSSIWSHPVGPAKIGSQKPSRTRIAYYCDIQCGSAVPKSIYSRWWSAHIQEGFGKALLFGASLWSLPVTELQQEVHRAALALPTPHG